MSSVSSVTLPAPIPDQSKGCLPLLAVIGALHAAWLCGPTLWTLGAAYWAVPPGDVAVGLLGMEAALDDIWHWPPGNTARLLVGNEAISIAYTDSLPVLAILLKVFGLDASSVPPFGVALFLGQVLQPVAAGWALHRAGVRHWAVLIPGALLLACMPAWYFRIGVQHFSLTWHWLILVALGFGIGWSRSGRIYGAEIAGAVMLCVVAAGTHAYLAIDVTTILMCGCFVLARGRQYGKAFAFGGALILFTAGGAFVVGLLPPPASGLAISLGAAEFGFFSFNLLAPFDRAYSTFWPAEYSVGATRGQYEGMAYLGAGILLLLGLVVISMAVHSLPLLRRSRFASQQAFHHRAPSIEGAAAPLSCWPLIIVVAGLAAYTIYPEVWWGRSRLIALPVPSAATFFLEQFRSSGRMIWPALYLLVLFLVVAVQRLGLRPAATVVTVALAIQIVDTANLRDRIRSMLAVERTLPVDVAVLREKGVLAGDVRLRPSWGCVGPTDSDNGLMLALEAIRAGGRVRQPPMARGAIGDCDPAVIASDAPLRDTTDLILRGALPMKDQAALLTKRDCVVTDGVLVCKGRRPPGELSIGEALALLLSHRPIEVGVRLPVSDGKVRAEWVHSGWSVPEPWGIWTEGPVAELLLPVPKETPLQALKLELIAYSGRPSQMQGLSVFLSGRLAWQGDLVAGQPTTIRVPIDSTDVTSGYAQATLRIADPQSPSSAGVNNDTRRLGVGLIAIELEGKR